MIVLPARGWKWIVARRTTREGIELTAESETSLHSTRDVGCLVRGVAASHGLGGNRGT